MTMTQKEKLEHLLELTEDGLLREVLVPLLTKQGFHDPILHHHANEKGKDIVCKELDEKFGKTRYIAVVVKRGKVTGSASGSNSYFTVINQIKQAINEPYKHVYELREVAIDQVIFVASGDILPTALDSVYSTLKNDRLDKAIRETIDGPKLLSLIDKFFPVYWDEIGDEKSSLLRQRNILLNNLGKLLKVLITDPVEREKALCRLAADELDIELFGMRDFGRYMLDLSYRRVSIEEIDPAFTLPYLNTGYGNIKQAVLDLKKKARKALMEMEELIEPLQCILEETNPKEILGYCDDVGRNTNHFGRMSVDVSDIYSEDLQWGIQQYEERREILEQRRQSELYMKLMNDMHARVKPALLQFWEKHQRIERNWWLGYSVQFSVTDQQVVLSSTYELEAEPKVLQEKELYSERELSKSFTDADGRFHIEFAVNWYGSFGGEELSLEDRAEEFMWHYEHLLADKFISTLESESLNNQEG
ncbi:MAG TPA: hypothetical protein VMW72_13505 [Sedimentisphaerales bacterium]|nr:hypothetical protein [Sedimentisphaerales bacterium]